MKKLPTERLPLMAWLVIPLLLAWLGTNYIIGAMRHPAWVVKPTAVAEQNHVFGAQFESTILPDNKWRWSGQGVITLWFDDAWLNQYSVAFPLLENRDLKAALAVPTQVIGYDAYMTWTQVKRLQYAGWDITPHSRTHNCDLVDLPINQIVAELEGSKRDLQSRGINHDIYVAPCGEKSENASAVIKKYFVASRSVERGFNTLPLASMYDWKIQQVGKTTTIEEIEEWIKQAKRDKTWLILMFHQITDKPDAFDTTPFILESTLEIVDRERIEVVIPSQIINIQPQ